MDINVDSASLIRELEVAQAIATSKKTIPILSHVLIVADGANGIDLSATDLDVAVRGRCEAAVVVGGRAALPARKLYEIAKSLPDATIRIASTTGAEAGMTVIAGAYRGRLQALPPEDFPVLPSPDGVEIVLPRAAVRTLIGRVKFAVAESDVRYFLNGALLARDGATLLLVATDGHRLAKASIAAEGPPIEPAIVPRKALAELAGILDGDGPDVAYVRGGQHLFFTTGPRLLISRMVDGQFPAYERVIPKASPLRVELDRAALAVALRRILLTAEANRSVRLDLGVGMLAISSRSAEIGDGAERLDVAYDGVPMTVAINASYLLDFLDVAGTDRIAWEWKDGESPQVFRPVGAEHEYTYVVMPMRL